MRRRVRLLWFTCPVLALLIMSGFFLIKTNNFNVPVDRTTTPTTKTAFSLAVPFKHATKSLAELGTMDELNSHVLFFNRIPKSGSEILILLLQWLQGWNNFRHIRLKGGNKKKLNRLEQEELVYEMHDVIRKEAVPLSFDRHVYFVNFTSFDRQSPTFINMIRDPADQIVARYYSDLSAKKYSSHSRSVNKKYFNMPFEKCLMNKFKNCHFQSGKPYDLTIPYFCGQQEYCMLLNNEIALKKAKMNVERYFTVVGVLEELNTTLEVFAHKVPYFFKGVQNLYYKDLLKPIHKKNKKKHSASKKIKAYLKKTIVLEYEFYEWIKSRLFKQLQIIYGYHNSH